MTDPFGASPSMSFGGPPQMPASSGSGPDALLAQIGLQPHQIAMLRQRMAGLPANQHAAFLRQNLMTIPGVQEKLQSLQTPLNATVQPVAPPPGMQAGMTDTGFQAGPSGPSPYGVPARETPGTKLTAGTDGMNVGFGGGPAPAVLPGDSQVRPSEDSSGEKNPKRFQGRMKHGKGLPPGQMRNSGGGRFNPQPMVANEGGQSGPAQRMTPRGMPFGNGQMRAMISGGGMDDPANYRMRRLTGFSGGLSGSNAV